VESGNRGRQPDDVEAIVEAVVRRSISRREFVRRASLLGLSAAAIAPVLAACGDDDEDEPTTSAAEPTTAAAEPATSEAATSEAATSEAATSEAATSEAATTEAAAWTPPRYDGTKVALLIAAEGDEKGAQDKVGEIKDRYGIDLEITALAIGPLLEKANQSINAPEGTFDVITVLGFSVSQMIGGDKFELLNPYLEDPAKTPPDYDFEDFPAGQLEYVGYYDIPNRQFGGENLYLLPGTHGGTAVTFYRTDLFEAAGIEVPQDPASWLAAAEALNKDGVAGNSMIAKSGDVSLFLVDWYTRFTALGGELMSGGPATKDFTPNLTSEPAVAALQHMIDCTKFAPSGFAQYDFTASVDGFAAGNTAMMLMWATIGGTVFNPEMSKVADKIDVAVPMGGKPVRGGLGIGIPKNSQNKDAAWAVVSYLTSKEWEKYQVGTYKTDPSRTSTFTDPDLVAAAPYLPVSGQAFESATILPFAMVPEAFELMTVCAEEFGTALTGNADASAACAKAQDRVTEVLKRGGHLA
jgi:multiple sugar transport system substrate-binding protein